MTATQRFIEKAIEGGWIETEEYSHVDMDGYDYTHEIAAVMDPGAWKAAGRVFHWPPVQIESLPPLSVQTSRASPVSVVVPSDIQPGWLYNMHRMIDALADGKSIEEFLATIV